MSARRRNTQPIRYFVGAGPLQTATSTAPKTVIPTEAKPGDVLLALVRVVGTQTITPAAGWTLVADASVIAATSHFSVFWKTMQNDPGADATWVLSGSANWGTTVYAFRHIDQITAIVDAAVKTEDVALSATATLPEITTTGKSILVGAISTAGSANRAMLSCHSLFKKTAVCNVSDSILLLYSAPVQAGAWGTFANTLSASAQQGVQTIALRVVS